MKIDSKKIKDQTNNEKVRAIIKNEWDQGKLYEFKKEYPDAIIVVSPDNNAVDYWGNIFNEKENLIGRFSIIGGELKNSILAIT